MTYLTAYKIVDENPRALVRLNPSRPGGRCVDVTAIAPALTPTIAVNPLILIPIHLLRLYSVCCLQLLAGFRTYISGGAHTGECNHQSVSGFQQGTFVGRRMHGW